MKNSGKLKIGVGIIGGSAGVAFIFSKVLEAMTRKKAMDASLRINNGNDSDSKKKGEEE